MDSNISRLDARAAALGLKLRSSGQTREFDAPRLGRVFRYRPAGKGTVRVEAFVAGQLDAFQVCQPDRVEHLFRKAVA